MLVCGHCATCLISQFSQRFCPTQVLNESVKTLWGKKLAVCLGVAWIMPFQVVFFSDTIDYCSSFQWQSGRHPLSAPDVKCITRVKCFSVLKHIMSIQEHSIQSHTYSKQSFSFIVLQWIRTDDILGHAKNKTVLHNFWSWRTKGLYYPACKERGDDKMGDGAWKRRKSLLSLK